jgi:hypothetical protein
MALPLVDGLAEDEAFRLEWRNVDFVSGTIRIEDTKSGEPRTLPFDALPELDALLRELREQTMELERGRGIIVPWVFHRANGKPIRGIRRVWVAATRAVGVPGRILHDFRRTAVRRMERAGVSRSVAMKVTGHKTEAIYRRYAIVAERDIAEGLAKVAAFQQRVARSAGEGQVRDKRVPSWVPSRSQVVDGLVAWDGVEPPTRGFSALWSTRDQTEPIAFKLRQSRRRGTSAGAGTGDESPWVALLWSRLSHGACALTIVLDTRRIVAYK